jgi:ABC-type molybdate transport system substrate-binding protein
MNVNFVKTLVSLKRRRLMILITTALTTMLIAIGLRSLTSTPVVAQSNTNLLVSAAASMKDVLAEIKPLYQQSQPNVSITYNFGASGALQRQIEQGAPVDVFISAAKKQVDALEQKNLLVPGSRTVIANNVRQVLASVESGNADAGLVYVTDARISNKVKVVVAADEKYHSPIIYPLAILKRSKNVDTAKNFSQFLASDKAKAVFKKYGFILP